MVLGRPARTLDHASSIAYHRNYEKAALPFSSPAVWFPCESSEVMSTWLPITFASRRQGPRPPAAVTRLPIQYREVPAEYLLAEAIC